MLALQSQGYLQQLTGWQLNDLLFSRSGIVLVMTFNIFPVVYFAVSRSSLLARADPAGGGRPRPWRHRLARLLARDTADALPGAGGGTLLAFTLAIEEFGVPAALGSRAGVSDADGRY